MPALDDEALIPVLESSLYPGAKPESIAMVLSYCRVNGLNPMLKPVHIVPTWVKSGRKSRDGDDIYEKRDVLMPGIADYRIKAARSGEYGGKSEPEFGPEKEMKAGGHTVRYPEWCKITIKRIVQGKEREFPAKEYWLENYAPESRKSIVPNTMWRKRPYGQLAKCCESQALRMAFPEFSGGVTAEEMEGKELFDGQTIEHDGHDGHGGHGGHGWRGNGRDSGGYIPPPPPPPPPPTEAEDSWIGQVERKILAANDLPARIAAVGKAADSAPSGEALEAIWALPEVRRLASVPDGRTQVLAHLARGRKRLAGSPKEQQGANHEQEANGAGESVGESGDNFGPACVKDRNDIEIEADIYDPRQFAQRLYDLWRTYNDADRAAMVEYNIDWIEEARGFPGAAEILKRLDTDEPQAVATVKIPTPRGRQSMPGYLSELEKAGAQVPPHLALAWIEAQRVIIGTLPPATLARALGTLVNVAARAAVKLPSWVGVMVRPPEENAADSSSGHPSPDPDQVWVDKRIVELAKIPEIKPVEEARKAYQALVGSEAGSAVHAKIDAIKQRNKREHQRLVEASKNVWDAITPKGDERAG